MLMLVKGIIASFLIRQVDGEYEDANRLIRRILSDVKMPTNIVGINSDSDVAEGLKDTLEWISGLELDKQLSSSDLVDRLRINTGFDNHYTETIADSIVRDEDSATIMMRIEHCLSEIKAQLHTQELNRTVREIYREINRAGGHVDKEEFLTSAVEKFEDLKGSLLGDKIKPQDSLDLSDAALVREKMQESVELVSGTGVLKTGLQGINDSTSFGGVPRGFYVNIAALQHHYKTGQLLDIFRSLAMYNKPYMWDASKKPLIMRVSFENDLRQDIPKLYRDIVGMETGRKVPNKDINIEEASELLSNRLGQTGYKTEVAFFSPNDFTPDKLIALLMQRIEEGYEIHAVVVDYMELIAKNVKAERLDQGIVNGIERVRGFCFPRGITCISAHQLSSEANDLSREVGRGFVRRVKTGNWYMNAKAVSTKFDIELFQHIVNVDGQAFLTMARGKVRSELEPVAERRKVWAYPFHEAGSIHDDVLKPESQAIYEFSEMSNYREGHAPKEDVAEGFSIEGV